MSKSSFDNILRKTARRDSPSDLKEIIESAGVDGEAKISLKELLSLLEKVASCEKVPKPMVNYVVHEVNLAAYARKQHVDVTMTLEIDVLSSSWLEFPLISEKVAISNFNIDKSHNGDSADGDEIVAPSNIAWLVNKQGSYYFISKESGHYTVTLTVEVSYLTPRNQNFVIDVPRSVRGHVSMTVEGENIDIKVDPAIYQHAAETSGNGKTVWECVYPPTDMLSIQWTQREREEAVKEEQPKEKKVVQEVVTAEQQTVYSVGEGVLFSQTNIHYALSNASRGQFDVMLPDKAMRILSVDGPNIKEWQVVSDNSDAIGATPDAASSKAKENEKPVLRIILDYPAETQFRVSIQGEVDLGWTSGQLTLSAFKSLGANREKGYVVVEARTNVEVEEADAIEVAVVDINELPSDLSSRLSNALMAYKFLRPSLVRIVLDVTKHGDTEVLVTAISEAKVEATISEEGKILHRLMLRVRNTQRQYLRATLPKDAVIWSTMVDGTATKPAVDSTGKVMVALKKTSASSSNTDEEFNVELVYLTQISVMDKKGKLTIDLARVDIPINHMFVLLRVPEQFNYGEFDGDLKEVPRWSKTPQVLVSRNYNANSNFRSITNVVQQNQLIRMDSRSDDHDLLSSCGLEYESDYPRMQKMKKATWQGVTPVKVDLPEIGRPFNFEKLLVVDEQLHLEVKYKKTTKSWWKKRRV